MQGRCAAPLIICLSRMRQRCRRKASQNIGLSATASTGALKGVGIFLGVFLDHAGTKPQRIGAQRGLVPLHAGLNPFQFRLGGVEQLTPLARPFLASSGFRHTTSRSAGLSREADRPGLVISRYPARRTMRVAAAHPRPPGPGSPGRAARSSSPGRRGATRPRLGPR